MENYFENHKKYNKVLFKYLGYEGTDVDYKQFTPHDSILGFEILRWVMHKIMFNPPSGSQIKIITYMKKDECEIYIQQWHDVSRTGGYVNVVHCKEICDLNGDVTEKKIFEEAILQLSHRATYNACVDYIIKTS